MGSEFAFHFSMAAVTGRDFGGWIGWKVGSMLCFPLSSYPVNTSWAFLGGVNRSPVFIKVKGSFGEKEFSRGFPGQTFSNPGIQLPCNGIELLLRVQGEVGSLWQVIAQTRTFVELCQPRTSSPQRASVRGAGFQTRENALSPNDRAFSQDGENAQPGRATALMFCIRARL